MKLKFTTIVAVAFATTSFFFSCGKTEDQKEEPKDPQLFQELYRNLHVGESAQVKGDNLGGIDWYSSSFFVAEIDASQHIVPKHVGLSFIYAQIEGESNSPFRVVAEVAPKYTDFDLPIICTTNTYEGIVYDQIALFGMAGTSHIKGYEKRILDSRSTSSLLVYSTGNPKSPYVTYQFENSLSTCGTLIDPAHLSNLPNFLNERYEVISIDLSKPAAYFIHKTSAKDNETIDYIGGLQYFSQLGGVLLAFMAPDKTKASSLESQLEALAEELNKVLQTH